MSVGIELSKLLERDLKNLSNELNLYEKEEDLWTVGEGITNSGGNLALHLCGNLKHFIGAILVNSGYKRDRAFEFSGKVSLDRMNTEIKETIEIVNNYLKNVSESELSREFPLQPLGYAMTVSEFLLHLYGHFQYHLGQINYHRRLLNLE